MLLNSNREDVGVRNIAVSLVRKEAGPSEYSNARNVSSSSADEAEGDVLLSRVGEDILRGGGMGRKNGTAPKPVVARCAAMLINYHKQREIYVVNRCLLKFVFGC